MKRLLTLTVLVAAIILVAFGTSRLVKGSRQVVTPISHEQAKTGGTETVTPKSAPPVTLIIPRLGITADVERVGMDAKGNMDVPKRNEDVAWFEPGYLPGVKGNAVIAGHLDTKTGDPAVFYHLAELQKGDTIRVVNEAGETLEFTVIDKANYPADDFPLVAVFGPADRPRLNLITCEGTWSSTKRSYSHRTVVYAELSS